MILFLSQFASGLVNFADMVAFHFLLVHVLLTTHTVVAFVCILVDVSLVLHTLEEVAHQGFMVCLSRPYPGIVAYIQLHNSDTLELSKDALVTCKLLAWRLSSTYNTDHERSLCSLLELQLEQHVSYPQNFQISMDVSFVYKKKEGRIGAKNYKPSCRGMQGFTRISERRERPQ